jgi:hypothetical protein
MLALGFGKYFEMTFQCENLKERPFVRPRRSEEDNKRILKIEYEGVN